MKRLSLPGAILLSALLLCGSSVRASGTATAGFADVQLQVFDLTPLDGIAPGFTMGAVATRLLVGIPGRDSQQYPPPSTPAELRLDAGPSFGAAGTNGVLGGLTSEVEVYPSLRSGRSIYAYAEQITSLILRPHTLLTVDGRYTTLSGVGPDPSEYRSTASGYLSIANTGGHVHVVMNRGSIDDGTRDEGDAFDEPFFVSYANGNDYDIRVSLTFSTIASSTVVQAIPEPSMLAMLCLGLLVTGAGAGWRRRRGAPAH